MSFQTINLADNKVLVRGEDVTGTTGETIVDGTEWAEINALTDHKHAHDAFDEAVAEFFAPLTEAMDKLEATAHAKINTDPLFYVTVEEGVEATPGRPANIAQLSTDSVILRLIEQDADTDRLVWVKDELVVTAAPAAATKPSFTEDVVGSEPTA